MEIWDKFYVKQSIGDIAATLVYHWLVIVIEIKWHVSLLVLIRKGLHQRVDLKLATKFLR